MKRQCLYVGTKGHEKPPSPQSSPRRGEEVKKLPRPHGERAGLPRHSRGGEGDFQLKNKPTLGISSCLLGNRVRYDGGHKLDRFLAHRLGKYVEWVPVCPEVECGLPVPRAAMNLVGNKAAPRLVTIGTGIDHTKRMNKWTRKRLRELERLNLCGFVFKARSPSSGMRGVKVYSAEGRVIGASPGLFAKAFQERFPALPVEDGERLRDPVIRKNFMERVAVYKDWLEFTKKDGSLEGLTKFHDKHRLIIISRGKSRYQALSRIIASANSMKKAELFSLYISTLMKGLGACRGGRKEPRLKDFGALHP